MKLDGSLEDVEFTRFLSVYNNQIRKFLKTSRFVEVELTSLLLVYYKLLLGQQDRNAKYITQDQLIQFLDTVFNINDIFTVDRIIHVVVKTYRNYVTPDEWIGLLEVFLKGTLDEQIRYCFSIFDVEGTKELTRDNLLKFFRAPFIEDDEDAELLKDEFIEIITRKMDKDRDGKISFEDYTKAVHETPCMLEFLGRCLPDIDTLLIEAHICNIQTILVSYDLLK